MCLWVHVCTPLAYVYLEVELVVLEVELVVELVVLVVEVVSEVLQDPYRQPYKINTQVSTWVKVFKISPEFRILRLTFHMESQPQNPEFGRLLLIFR